MSEIKLTLELVNALMGYLGTRPYHEVANLIAETQKQAAGQVPFIPEHDINLTGKGGVEKLIAEGVLQ